MQLGGGIRTVENAQHYIDAGISYLIIGTLAVKEPEFVDELCQRFPGKVIVGLDAKRASWQRKAGQRHRRYCGIVSKTIENVGVSALFIPILVVMA